MRSAAPLGGWNRLDAPWARLRFGLQRLRLRVDGVLANLSGRRHRMVATASWHFPLDSHESVYRELQQFLDDGLGVCVFYAEPAPGGTAAARFPRLWRGRRRLILHPAVCRASLDYFERRRPERLSTVVDLLAHDSGMSADAVRQDPQFQQACAFARLVDAYRPAYLHSHFFHEGSLFVLVASCLLHIPRGVSCVDDPPASDHPLKAIALHLRQSSLVVAATAGIQQTLRALEPRMIAAQIVAAADGTASARVRHLMTARPARGPAPAATGTAADVVVSVVVIFLNAQAYLSEAIESVLLQTYDRWELLLVDDGSTDGSSDTARAAAARHPGRIRYLEHDGHRNLGMSASRNAGVAAAAGRYIAFLDADDIWAPFKLDQQVALLDAHPQAAMVFGAAEYWHGWTNQPADRERDHVPSLGIEADRVFAPPELSLRLYPLGTGTAPCPSDLLVRREAYNSVGGFEESFRHENQLYEDQAFLAKMYLAHAVYISSASWIRYRIHPDSCSSAVQGAGRYQAVRRHFLDWLAAYLDAQGNHDAAVAAALARARVPLDSTPAAGRPVDLGDLRRLTPLSPNWGFERGRPIDRVYIEHFLARQNADVRGRVLEIEDNVYTRRFGGDRVLASDVLHVVEGNPRATIVGDLTCADHIPSNAFDCVVLTQVLQLIFDTPAALRTLHRILAPGGVLLATFPGLSRISHTEWDGSWFWQFTSASARRLLQEAFPGGDVRVEVFGNVLTATAFLYGLAAEELTDAELTHHDPDYEVLIAIRAEKRSS